MCGMPGCTTVPRRTRVDTMQAGTQPVTITFCPDCDTRTCGTVVGTRANGESIRCTDRIASPTARKCPQGHVL